MNLRPRFSLKRLLRHGRAEVRRSLQARTVALTVILTLAVAIVFSGVSMVSVRASLLTQITSQSRADYSNMVQQAQTSLDAADVSATVQIQQLVNELIGLCRGHLMASLHCSLTGHGSYLLIDHIRIMNSHIF